MNTLHFSENLTRLRREKQVTQEQLADFVGVTKASVSKWETGQSLPDILLLPQIAAYFDVSIDELLGYEPQLSKEQIQKIYFELANAFAEKPFEEVMEKCHRYIKQYYSCYAFLLQVCCLWLNHFMLAKDPARQIEILNETSKLCRHIIDNCTDIGICNDAVSVDATIMLQLGRANEAIDLLEEIQNPCSLSRQSDATLIQAYQMLGDMQKADEYAQIYMYLSVLELVGCATLYLTIHGNDLACCEETIRRVEELDRTYDLSKLHPNIMLTFHYQAAIMYVMQKKEQEALNMMHLFVKGMDELLKEKRIELHGDAYFNKLDVWFEKLQLGGGAPRDKKLVFESAMSVFSNPVFQDLEDTKEWQRMKTELMKKGETL